MSAAGEAKPSQGPKGTAPRDREEADTCCLELLRHFEEADA